MPPRADVALALLAETVLTTAVTGQAGAERFLPVGTKALAVQVNFTYGSGGTSAKLYVQTSLDKGLTWIDIACVALTTASARRASVVHLMTALAPAITPADGALADNTILNGILGDRVRTKLTTVGTYAGNTRIQVDAVAKV